MKCTKMKWLKLGSLCFTLMCITLAYSQSPVKLFTVDRAQELNWRALRSKTNVRVFNYDATTYAAIKAERPALLNLIVPALDGNEQELELIENNVFSPGFKLTNEKGEEVPYTPGLFYKGKIKGDDKSFVTISLFDNEVMGIIARENLSQQVIGKSNALRSNSFMLVDQADMDNPGFTCLTEELPQWPNQVKVINEGLRSSFAKCVDVFFEIGNSIYTFKGNSVTGAADFVSGLFNGTSSIYSNESISTSISQMRVWTAVEPYSGLGFSSSIGNFNGDLAHYVKMATGSGASGVAYLPGLCGSSYAYSELFTTGASYPSYSWNVNVITHEMGHNLGSPHTQSCSWPGGAIDGCYDPEGSCAKGPIPAAGKGTIMSYCHLTSVGINFANGFGPLPGAKIRDVVNSAGCISDCSGDGGTITGGGTTPPPPPPTSSADLRVNSISCNPSSITAVTQTFTLSYSIANGGTATAGASTARSYFSLNTTVSNDDQNLGDASIPSLSTTAIATGSLNLQMANNATSGTYYLIVCADINNGVAESNETNNCSVTTITLTLPGSNPPPPPPPPAPTFPDLALEISSSIPNSVSPGIQIPLSGTITNIGNGTASASVLQAVLSTDNSISAGDIGLYQSNITALSPGAKSVLGGTMILPSSLTASNYYLIICADAEGSVIESSENNNCTSYVLNVNIPKPELNIIGLKLSQNPVPVNTPFAVNFTTSNSGSDQADLSTTGVYLSTNATLDNSDPLLGSVNLPSLPATANRADQLNINTKINPGNYFIIVCADSRSQIAETNETNNCSSIALTVTNPLPDLVIESIDYPTQLYIGEGSMYSINIKIKNSGAKKSEPTSGYLKLGPNANESGSALLAAFNIPALEINQSYDTTVLYGGQFETVTGNKFFITCVDQVNKITESNENNNCRVDGTSVIVPVADLYNITAVSYNESFGRGGKIKVPFKMTNIGTKKSDTMVVEYYLSTKAMLKSGNPSLYLDTIRLRLNPGDTFFKMTEVRIPTNVGVGSYYINLCIDYNYKTKEITKNNNCQSVRISIRDPKPDLIINSISLADTALVYGKTNKINLSIANIGEAVAVNSTTQIWYRGGTKKDSVIIGEIFIDSLKAEKSLDTQIIFNPISSLADSTIYFTANADALSVVAESKETNNAKSFSVVPPKKMPDIYIADLVSPPYWESEEEYEISYSLKNLGLNGTGDFSILYVIKDTTGSKLLSKVVNYVSVAAGDSSLVNTKLKLPIDIISGMYTLDIIADSENKVEETDETNNSLGVQIGFTQKQADIEIMSLTTQDTIHKGSTATVKVSVMNKGNWVSIPLQDELDLTNEKSLTKDALVLNKISVPALAPGESRDIDVRITIPDKIATSTYFIQLQLDADEKLVELNESNNSSSFEIVVPNKKADLKHAGLVLEHGTMYQGDSMHIQQFIRNIGETPSGEYDLSVYIKKNLSDAEPIVLFEFMAHGQGILPELSSEFTSAMKLPDSIQAGVYYLIACVDPQGKVDELTKSNNCGQIIITIEKKASLTTSVHKKVLFETTLVYPNPATNVLNVNATFKETAGKTKVDIKDYMGRIVSTASVYSGKNLNYQHDISRLHSGWYVIEFNSDKGSWRQPFLKF